MTYEPTPTKICSKCGECKAATTEFFCKKTKHRDGLNSACKYCQRYEKSLYLEKTKKTPTPRKLLSDDEKRNRTQARKRSYYLANKEKTNARTYRNQKNRLDADPAFAMHKRVSRGIRRLVGRMLDKKQSTTSKIIGCTKGEFKTHIESKFLEGMTWDNRVQWHIDHIIPLATAKTVEDVIRLNHYTNLRPLWATDNLRKGAKLDYQL